MTRFFWLNGESSFPDAYLHERRRRAVDAIGVPSHDRPCLGHYKGAGPGGRALRKAIAVLMETVRRGNAEHISCPVSGVRYRCPADGRRQTGETARGSDSHSSPKPQDSSLKHDLDEITTRSPAETLACLPGRRSRPNARLPRWRLWPTGSSPNSHRAAPAGVFPRLLDERMRWHFIPNEMFPRKGVALRAMTPPQRERDGAAALSGLSQRGYVTATAIIELENVLREIREERALRPRFRWTTSSRCSARRVRRTRGAGVSRGIICR